MLPPRDDPTFPEALRKARQAKNLKLKDLANAVGIDPAMPGRYENREHSWHSKPSQDTWEKLNSVLCNDSQTTACILPKQSLDTTPICDATIEQLISELKRRGMTEIHTSWS